MTKFKQVSLKYLERVHKLNSKKEYPRWRKNLQTAFVYNDMESYLHLIPAPPRAQDRRKWEREKKSCTAFIIKTISKGINNSVQEHFQLYPAPWVLIDYLEQNYKESGSKHLSNLYDKYQNLALHDCKDVIEYSQQLNELKVELLNIETITICDTLHVQRFVKGLGPTYKQWYANYLSNHDLTKVKYDETVCDAAAQELDKDTTMLFDSYSLRA